VLYSDNKIVYLSTQHLFKRIRKVDAIYLCYFIWLLLIKIEVSLCAFVIKFKA
jgi:uncharacterized membrane protein